MRIILDTNVFVSGVFFSGPPNKILQSWRDRKIKLVVSPEIIQEYQRVADVLKAQFSGVDLGPVIDLLIAEGEVVSTPALPEQIRATRTTTSFLLALWRVALC